MSLAHPAAHTARRWVKHCSPSCARPPNNTNSKPPRLHSPAPHSLSNLIVSPLCAPLPPTPSPATATYTPAHRHSLAHHRANCIVHPIHSGSAFLPTPSPLHPAGPRLLLPQPDLHPRRPPPLRRYVCFVNTSASAPSLVVTPPPRSRSRCHSSRREYVARSLLVAGRARVGWWALVPDRMGGASPCPPFPRPRPYCTPRLARGHRHARYSNGPVLPTSKCQQGFGDIKKMRVNGTRCAHPHRLLNSAWPPTRSGARTTLVLSLLRGRQR